MNRLLGLRGVFVGSGSDGMGIMTIAEKVLSLIPGPVPVPKVVYLGTATYDLPGPRKNQTQRFIDLGCDVVSLDITDDAPSTSELEGIISSANVIIVSGGNTLYAVDRWRNLGLFSMIQKASEKGAVLTGGSAGAICWFTSGHSDSMDPATYKEAMRRAASGDASADESDTGETGKAWEYIRVPGMGLLPGLICPHYDRVQSNGLLRAEDFFTMAQSNPAERGIGIDHWAALVLPGDGSFEVFPVEGKQGSVVEGNHGDVQFKPEHGKPGIWVVEAGADGKATRRHAGWAGKLEDLLREPRGPVKEDPRVEQCRKENPQPEIVVRA